MRPSTNAVAGSLAPRGKSTATLGATPGCSAQAPQKGTAGLQRSSNKQDSLDRRCRRRAPGLEKDALALQNAARGLEKACRSSKGPALSRSNPPFALQKALFSRWRAPVALAKAPLGFERAPRSRSNVARAKENDAFSFDRAARRLDRAALVKAGAAESKIDRPHCLQSEARDVVR